MRTWRCTRSSTPFWAHSAKATSACTSRRAIRNGAAPRPTVSSPSRSSGSRRAADALPISTSLSCVRRRASARIATPCARASPRSPAFRSRASGGRRPPARSLASPDAAKASRHSPMPRSGCLGASEMEDAELLDPARALLDLCRTKSLKVAAAESCTGGLLAATLTEIPGSSDVFERGFVTYSNEAKQAMLGVGPLILAKHGAVSREIAEAMARGVLAHAPVDLAVSITGIAGPGGAVAGKPVGLVHLAAVSRSGRCIQEERRYGDIGRAEIRRASVIDALAMLGELAAAERPEQPSSSG